MNIKKIMKDLLYFLFCVFCYVAISILYSEEMKDPTSSNIISSIVVFCLSAILIPRKRTFFGFFEFLHLAWKKAIVKNEEVEDRRKKISLVKIEFSPDRPFDSVLINKAIKTIYKIDAREDDEEDNYVDLPKITQSYSFSHDKICSYDVRGDSVEKFFYNLRHIVKTYDNREHVGTKLNTAKVQEAIRILYVAGFNSIRASCDDEDVVK